MGNPSMIFLSYTSTKNEILIPSTREGPRAPPSDRLVKFLRYLNMSDAPFEDGPVFLTAPRFLRWSTQSFIDNFISLY